MKTELYRAIKAIDIKNLNEEDKDELLRIFTVTKNDLIRNQIAFIFSDLRYVKAVPYIFKKINDISLFNNNGSLVHALEAFDLKEYFIPLIKIIYEQGYEARLVAFGIVKELLPSISNIAKRKAMKILEEHRLKLEQTATDEGENSTLHFVEKANELLS